MKAFLCLILLLPMLSGCGGVVMGLSAAASVVSISRNVLDIDTSLMQNDNTKPNKLVPSQQ